MSIPREHQWPADKRACRQAIAAWRDTLSPEQRTQTATSLQSQISARLRRYLNEHGAGRTTGTNGTPVLAVYWPIRSEPDLRDSYPQWRAFGFELALPVTPAQPGPLRFAAWSAGAAMTRDAMGIQTPTEKRWVQPALMIIPCLGYALPHWRLGYGGGYYDRTLKDFAGLTIGVALAATELSQFEPSEYDIALHEVITS